MPERVPDPIFRTKREVALDSLQKAIRLGRYAPGQPLRQIQLVKDLGVGSTPVREAVLELLAPAVGAQAAVKVEVAVRVLHPVDAHGLRGDDRVRALPRAGLGLGLGGRAGRDERDGQGDPDRRAQPHSFTSAITPAAMTQMTIPTCM